jgi:hypothetical protein
MRETRDFIVCFAEERMACGMKHLVPSLNLTLQHGNVHTVELRLKIECSRPGNISSQAIVSNVTARAVICSNQPSIVVRWRCLPRGTSRVASRSIDLPVVTYPAQGTGAHVLCERYHYNTRECGRSGGGKSTPGTASGTLQTSCAMTAKAPNPQSPALIAWAPPCDAAMPAQMRSKAKSVVASEAC